jgi:rhodanese-related sulfurtransferase
LSLQAFIDKGYIDSEELQLLLDEREAKKTDFILVDVREEMEYKMGHVKGVDMLKPTSEFSEWALALLNESKDKTLIFTCRTGSRSGQVQNVFKQNGHLHTINHYGGIVSYRGEVER